MDDRIETDILAPEIKAEAREVDWHKLNRLYVTRRLPMIQECGHKFDSSREPKNNCEWCWFTYFNSNGEMVKAADQCFQEAGKDVLERIKGKRFVKMFVRFMATVAKFVAEQKAKEQNGQQGTN